MKTQTIINEELAKQVREVKMNLTLESRITLAEEERVKRYVMKLISSEVTPIQEDDVDYILSLCKGSITDATHVLDDIEVELWRQEITREYINS